MNLILKMGLLKKATSGVLANFRCSRTNGTLRAQNWLRPCWMAFFEPTRNLWQAAWLWANWLLEFSIIQHSQDSLYPALGFTEKKAMLAFGHYNHPTTKIQNLSGHLDAHSNLGLEGIISQAENGKCDHLILNFSNITGMDLGGVGQLFTWYFNLKANRIRLSIVSPQPFVRDALEAAHLPELIPIYHSVPEAMLNRLSDPVSPH